ncbi:MAG: pyridoxamine 5'-phosphate oxidase family protein [Methanosarcinales archaeon]|nr:pyridoxamine 5'-phosphate oxidase family protein [Methanosarcinales archaeon]
MALFKLPRMEKSAYDRLIKESHLCRIAFKGDSHPYMAPFIYVFDGRHMYFLSTRYGKKLRYFQQDPRVSVEVEQYAPDLSRFSFVALRGELAEVEDPAEGRRIREMFVDLIRERELSRNILSALGHHPDDPLERLVEEDRNLIWKLVKVEEIVGLQDGKA